MADGFLWGDDNSSLLFFFLLLVVLFCNCGFGGIGGYGKC